MVKVKDLLPPSWIEPLSEILMKEGFQGQLDIHVFYIFIEPTLSYSPNACACCHIIFQDIF